MHQQLISAISKSNKIVIIGSPGSGKTFLSKYLSKNFNFDVYHWDNLYWKSGWTRTSQEYICKQINDVISKPRWILEGNYFHYMFQERLFAADTIILLKTQTLVCLYRVIMRYIKIFFGDTSLLPVKIKDNLITKKEKVHFDFKFIKYVVSFNRAILPQMEMQMQQFSEKVIVVTPIMARNITGERKGLYRWIIRK